MNEPGSNKNRFKNEFKEPDAVNRNKVSELTEQLTELQKANKEIREARRAALNMMEDAILSKEALRKSEEKYRTKLEQEVRDRTAELNENKELLQATMDASMDIIQVFEAVRNEQHEIVDFKYVLINHAAEKWMPGNTIGNSLLKLQPGVVQEGIFDTYKTVVETGIPNQSERRYVHEQFDGWFLQSAVKMGDGVATTTSNITERKLAELEVIRLKDEIAQKATDKYYSIFNSIDDGLAIVEVFPDENDRVTDMIWLEVNAAVERNAGISGWIGKRASEIVPNLEQEWLDTMTSVYQTGKPVRMEAYIADLDRWISTYYGRIGGEGSRLITSVFRDITERKRREQQQAYLLELSDALKTINDPHAIQFTAVTLLGRYLKAARAGYAEDGGDGENVILTRNYIDGVPGIEGSYHYDDYGPGLVKELRAGRTVVRNDIANDATLTSAEREAHAVLQLGATVNVPLVKNGHLVAILFVHFTTAHRFSGQELTLIEETAQRTWAALERAKVEEALAHSEENYRAIVNQSISGIFKVDLSGKLIFSNEYFEKMTGYTGDELMQLTISDIVYEEDLLRTNELFLQLITEGKAFDIEKRLKKKDGALIWVLNHISPIYNSDHKPVSAVVVSINITERKKAEEALRQRERELARVQLIGNIGGVDINVEENLSGERSPEYLRLHGLSEKNKNETHKDWLHRIHPEDRAMAEQTLFDALKNVQQLSYESEYRIIRPNDKAVRWIYAKLDIERNTEGKPLRLVGVHIDITQRKNAEIALRESEERARITMESAVDFAIINTNAKGLVESWNSGAERIFEFSAEEMIGKPADIIFTEEDIAAGVPEQEMATARTKGRASDERWHKRKDESRFFASGVMRPIYNPELTGYVKIASDMTLQKQAEENLRMLEERYRIALQSANMAAWDWNVPEDIVEWNDEHFYILGLPLDSHPKTSADFIKHVYKNDVDKVAEELQKAVNMTGFYHTEFRVVRADNGDIRWMNGYGRAVSSQNNKATRMIGVMFDITERKLLEEQKDDFIIIASHELKTPVTSIKIYTEILKDELDAAGDPYSKDLVVKLDKQIDRFTQLISLLLDTTKISQGQLELYPSTFNLNELIAERIEEFEPASQNHAIIFAPKEEIIISADKTRIGEVITNLISNAIKYSPGKQEILIQSSITKSGAQVTVKDYGLGIPESLKDKLFERFYRIRNAKADTFPGMGLGLYISASILKQHGGKIWVESEPGKGSIFYFTLPVKYP